MLVKKLRYLSRAKKFFPVTKCVLCYNIVHIQIDTNKFVTVLLFNR